MKNRSVLLFASIIIIVLLAWHFGHAQTFWNGGYPCGQAISLNGTSQYLAIADNAGSLDQTLDLGPDDFMYSCWSNIAALPTNGSYCTFGSKAVSSNLGWSFHLYNNSGSYNLNLILGDGTQTLFTVKTGWSVMPSLWYNIVLVADRSNKAYAFVNGILLSSVTISSRAGNSNSIAEARIGREISTYANIYIDCIRMFRMGVNGLTVTGTGGVDLSIKLGTITIYSEVAGDGGSVAAPAGLIPLMYKSPSKSLTQLGFASIDQAVRTNKHDGAGNVTGLTVGNWYFFDQGTAGHDLSGCGTLSADGVFAATATTGAISSGDANDTVRRIGCVAEWNLNNALTDGSGNGLTLTNNESAPFVTSKIEALGSVLRSDGSISIHRSVQ